MSMGICQTSRRAMRSAPKSWRAALGGVACSAMLSASLCHAASLSASLASESLGVSSGLVSDSVSGASRGSSKAVGLAQGPWRVMQVAYADPRPVLTLRQDGRDEEVKLHLPVAVVRDQSLTPGAVIAVAERDWGYSLSREGGASPFFVLLHDHWAQALQARPLQP